MRVLIDTRCLQAATHFGKAQVPLTGEVPEEYKHAVGKRLEEFLQIVNEFSEGSPQPTPGEPDELQKAYIGKFDCLVFTTRIYHPSPSEIASVQAFYQQGGSLLIMSNHTPFEWADNALIKGLGFSLTGRHYPWHGFGLTAITPETLGDHFITKEISKPIIFRNCCHITIENDTAIKILARLPLESPPHDGFAIACENENGGRLVCIADSGFACSPETDRPGLGLISGGGNIQVLRNTMRWLAHRE